MIGLAADIQFKVASFRDLHRVADGFRKFLEQLAHLLRSLDVKLLVGKAHPVRIVHRLAGLDTEQDFMGKSVFTRQVVAIIGRNQRQPELLTERDQALIGDLLLREIILLKL